MELEDFIAAYGGKILDMTEPPEPTARFSTLPDSFSARLRISGAGLRDLVLNWAYLFEVTEAETVKINPTMDDTAGDTVFPSILPPPSFSPIVCVIDSGIQEGHKYLSDAIIKEDSLSLLPRNPSVTDEAGTSGHGTRVAGAVLYPDGLPRQGTYQLPCRLRNLRVLDRDNCLPPALYPPRIIEKAVRIYHHEKSQRTKIFNQSIGANTACRLTHMSAWAAAIDNQSYENDILFIQAAGNISSSTIKHFLQHDINYPDYFKEDAARISNPAQSLQALTVGSVSSSDFETKDLIALGRMDEVSSFSRCGPGIWDTIKPDVVEYGGTQVCTKDHKMPLLTTPPPVCPELLRKSPEGCAYARDDVGTSFAAPKVASIAARLEQLLPDSPALLYRALIAQSARWPTSADHISKETALSLIRHMGYGIPDLKRATENDDYRITLITPQLLQLGEGEAHIFQIPIPEELSAIDKDYDILLEITLSYAAKPRRTRRRVNGYLSTWLDWRCSRMGEAAENFSRRIFDTGKRVDDDGNFHWAVGEQMNHGLLADISRRNGTLQKDWCLLKSNQLSDKFCIAVRGHKG